MSVDRAHRAGPDDEELRTLTATLAARGLAVPAMLLLEAALPLHLLAQQACYIAHPLLRPWLGDGMLRCAELLGDAAALQRAIEHLAVAERAR